MSVIQRGETSWRAEFMFKGARYNATFDDRDEARAWELKARAALKRGEGVPDPQATERGGGAGLSWGCLLDRVWKLHWSRLERSAGNLKYKLRAAKTYFGAGTPVKEIGRARINDYIEDCIDQGNSPATLNRKLSFLNTALKEAEAMGAIAKRPVLPHYKEGGGRIRFLSDEEEDILLGVITRMGFDHLRAFVVTALDTGCRASELLSMQWRDVDKDMATVSICKNKADHPRTLHLTRRVRAELRFMKTQNPQAPGPFAHMKKGGALRTQWERVINHIGWDDVVIHTLRHTCASRLAISGVDMKRIQTWMGHKSITTTQRYTHLMPGHLKGVAEVLEQGRSALRAVS